MRYQRKTARRKEAEEGLTPKEKEAVKEVMDRNDKALKTLSEM